METQPTLPDTKKEETKKTLILVLEDDPHLNRIIVHKLKERGYDPILATTAQEAIDILEKGDRAIDIMWLDVLLPGMSGLEFLKYVKDQEKFKHIKAFIVSASGATDQEGEALRLGAEAYIVKGNYGLDEIIERVVAD